MEDATETKGAKNICFDGANTAMHNRSSVTMTSYRAGQENDCNGNA